MANAHSHATAIGFEEVQYQESEHIPTSKSKNSIFGPRLDALNIGIAALVAIFAILQVTDIYAPFNYWSSTNQSFLENVIFLNAVHITFTYISLLTIPELRQWTIEVENGHPWRFWGKTLAVIFALTLLFFAGALKVNVDTFFKPWANLVLITWPFYHGIWQTRGMSLQYTYRLITHTSLTAAERKKIATRSGRERILFGAFISVIVAMNLVKRCPDPWRPTFLNGDFTMAFVYSSSAVAVLIIIAILINALSFPTSLKYKKALYLGRLFVYPFEYITVVFIGKGLMHGFEYLLVTHKLERSSGARPKRSRFYFYLITVGVLYGIYWCIVYYHLVTNQHTVWGIAKFWPRLAFAGFTGVNISHYYVDSRLFRMANPATRRRVGSLLNAD